MNKFLIFPILIILTGCLTRGSHVVTGELHPVISADAVKIYSELPKNSVVVGLVSCSTVRVNQRGMNIAVAELKKQAALMGANGVFVEKAFLDADSAKTSGKAIFVSP